MSVSRKKRDDFVPKGMKHSDFKIGSEFLTETGRWRCTDVGTRTIAAIKLDHDHDPAWYNGPLTRSRSMFSMRSPSRDFHRRRSTARMTTAADRQSSRYGPKRRS